MTVQEYLTFAAELKGVKKAERKEQVCRAARRTGLGNRSAPAHPQPFQGLQAAGGHCTGIAGQSQAHHSRRADGRPGPGTGHRDPQAHPGAGPAHTVILSSHILSEVQAVCQQILILSKGHLAAAGSLEELTADGKSLEEVFLELTDGEPEEATGEEDAE